MKIRFSFLLLIFFACSQNKQSPEIESFQQNMQVEDTFEYYPIKDNRIKVDLNKPQKASLFDYFSHIELIPLETNDSVLIASIYQFIHYQGRYYVCDRRQFRIFVFDDTGKSVLQIKKRGQGPGEYIDMGAIFLNPFTNNIDILDLTAIHSYDLSGKYVKTVHLDPSIIPLNFIALNEKTYIFWSTRTHNPESPPSGITYYDAEESTIIHQEYELDSFFSRSLLVIGSFIPSRFYCYQEKWFFSHYVDNETYEIGEQSLIKAYTWDFGRYNYDPKKLNIPLDPSIPRSPFPYNIRFQSQNNKYVMAYCSKNRETNFSLIYDKSTDKCKLIEHFTESVDFLPIEVTNEYVLSHSSHGELKNFISEEMLDENNRQIFKDLMNSKEEENPIIIKYYFK